MRRSMTFLIGFLALVSIGACSGGGSSPPPPKTLAAVAPLFPNNGANWNQYVPGTDWSTATDTACTVGSYLACLNGGEYQVVEATGKTSCTGLTAEDALKAFTWVCDASTGTARFISTGFAKGKYLSDLIDFTVPAFKADSVTIYDNGVAWGQTPSSVWWTNPLVVNNNGASMTAAGTIYLVTANPHADYSFGASQVGLVVQPGVTLSGLASAGTVVDFSSVNFDWFEGAVDGTGDTTGVSLSSSDFNTLRNVTVSNITTAGGYGIYLNGGSNNRIIDATASNNTSYGIYVTLATYNTFTNTSANSQAYGFLLSNVSSNTFTNVSASGNTTAGMDLAAASSSNTISGLTVTNNPGVGLLAEGGADYNNLSSVEAIACGTGIRISGSAGNVLTDSRSVDNTSMGVDLETATGNILSGINVSSNNTNGIYLYQSTDNTLSGIVASGNGTNGIAVESTSDSNVIAAVTAANNFSSGVLLDSSSGNTLSSIAAANNPYGVLVQNTANGNTFADTVAGDNFTGVQISSANDSYFTGLFEVGNVLYDCYLTGTNTNPGLDASCNPQGASDFGSPITGITLANSFVGKVATDDASNTSDSNGAASYPANPTTFDWTHFDNAYRAWGIDGSAFPNADNQGQWTSGTGRIWDWSAATSDSGNGGSAAILAVLAVPTGSDTLTHIWSNTSATPPSDTATCNAMVPGSTWNGTACQTVYLRHAVEISGDGIGNDNLLCESGETCLYTPNLGSYQGHGTLVSAGPFTGGTITGVTLMQYGTNGR